MKHVIWDWNGTLYDDVHVCVESLNSMLDKRGKKPITIEQYMEVFDFPVKQVYPKLGFNMDEENWDKMAREYHDEYLSRTHKCRLRHGIRRLLEQMKKSSIAMSIVSACEISILTDLIEKTGIKEFFAEIKGLSDLFAASKMETAQELMERIRPNASSVIFIGDTLHDYEIARKLNCRCVLLTGGHQTEQRLRSAKCPVLCDVAELEQFL